jgi:NAD(P)-dependent dehydrogenase (short-subunit alcohol dehydrogenase family)
MISLNDLTDLQGRRILITGGTGHLGQVMVRVFAELGADLIILDRPKSDFSIFNSHFFNGAKINALFIECDLESETQRNDAIMKIKSDRKGLNCLINNAAFVGISGLKGLIDPFEKQTLDTWRRVIEVNLTAPFHLSQAFTPELREAKGGNIINITSIYGELGPDWRLYEGTGLGNPASYAASKGGLVQLTRWLSTTLAPEIRVNAISPGGVYRNQPEVFVDRYKYRTPLGRMANEQDFMGALALLASDSGRYITGQIISIDGGWSSW